MKCGKNCLFVPWSNKLEMVVWEWMFLLLAPCPRNRRFLSRIPFSCKMRTVIDHFSVSGVNASPWISKRRYKTQTVVLWWSSSSRTCYTSIMNEWMSFVPNPRTNSRKLVSALTTPSYDACITLCSEKWKPRLNDILVLATTSFLNRHFGLEIC